MMSAHGPVNWPASGCCPCGNGSGQRMVAFLSRSTEGRLVRRAALRMPMRSVMRRLIAYALRWCRLGVRSTMLGCNASKAPNATRLAMAVCTI